MEAGTQKNFQHVFGSVYKVMNQNGFNNALYDAIGCIENKTDVGYTKKELRKAVQSYPTQYPATVQFDDKMLECARVYVSITYEQVF